MVSICPDGVDLGSEVELIASAFGRHCLGTIDREDTISNGDQKEFMLRLDGSALGLIPGDEQGMVGERDIAQHLIGHGVIGQQVIHSILIQAEHC